jgi:thiopurine S-methyltransferase
MEHSFWRERWQQGRTRFHEGKPNSLLANHLAVLSGCRRILVPLCGKAEDLAFLAGQGHDVVGIELVEDAVRQFFDEHGTMPAITSRGDLRIYTAGAITIIAGDFFATTESDVGAIDGIYDRAALVALPTEMRKPYVEHAFAIAPRAASELLIAFEDALARPDGPPFHVPEAEVRALYAGRSIELIASAGPADVNGRMLVERCYAIRAR